MNIQLSIDQLSLGVEYCMFVISTALKLLAPGVEASQPSRLSRIRRIKMDYAAEHQIPIEMKRGKESPFSMDATCCTSAMRVACSRTRGPNHQKSCGVGR